MSTPTLPFLFDEAAFNTLCSAFVKTRRWIGTQRKDWYHRVSGMFRRWMLSMRRTVFDENSVKAWMLHRLSSARRLNCHAVHAPAEDATVRIATIRLVSVEANGLAHFVDFLIARGLWSTNPFRSLQAKHRAKRMRGIVRRLAETRMVSALDADTDVPFQGPLGSYFRGFLKHLQSLGINVYMYERHLSSFERYLHGRGITALAAVSRKSINEWNCSRGAQNELNRYNRLFAIARFMSYLVGHQLIAASPLPQVMSRRRHSLPPYIYSHAEISGILRAAAMLPDRPMLLYRGQTYRMLFLYTLGLRRSEALELKLEDIDFGRHALTVREGKFRKGRVLPFGPRYGAALQQYIAKHPWLRKVAPGAYLFPARQGRLTGISLKPVLDRILRDMHVVAKAGTRRPTVHSLRHSFAVHRVERWHRERADLGAKLPLLSAFMGHVDICSTQVYLTMTPERLRLIGDVFELAFGKKLTKECSSAEDGI
jgi:site-specific recombinase XerD